MLGYPEAALADAEQAVKDARENGQAATLMYALLHVSVPYIHCGNYEIATAVINEVAALADEKGSLFWKPHGMAQQGCLFGLTGKASNAIQMLTTGIATFRSTGSTPWIPIRLAYLAMAHAELGNSDDAWHCVAEAMSAIRKLEKRGMRPKSIVQPAKLRCCRANWMQGKRRRTSSMRSRLHVSSKRSPGNSAPP